MIIKNINISKKITLFLFLISLLIGVLTFKDYGIAGDEDFHRAMGFYWLDYILNFTPFQNLKDEVGIKLSMLQYIDFQVITNSYGVIFDVPAALLEVLFKIDDPKNYFYFKHFLTFVIFFLGSVFFYKLLINRFSDDLIAMIGTLFFFISPRIYGNSFYNPKDIIFLSLISIAIYYCFKLFDKISYKNFLIFALFSALATSQRIFGIFLPLSFLGFYLLSVLSKKEDISYFPGIIFFCISFFVFLISFWPYLWSDPVGNFLTAYNYFSHHTHLLTLKMLFNGEYVATNSVPYEYIVTWITITTPTLYLLLFIFGYFFIFKKFFLNFINVKEKSQDYDLWNNSREKKDLFMMLNFTIIIFYLILVNASMFTGWRHLYFTNIFIIYIATFTFHKINLKLKKEMLRKLFFGLTFFYLFFISYKMFNLHPYQNIYFNSVFTTLVKNIHKKFEIDYWGLTGKKALENILNLEKNKNSVSVAVASYLPLDISKKLLNKNDRKRIKIVGQDYLNADYIYTNFVSEVDKNYNDKYKIPTNFSKINTFISNNVVVYEIYKKNE